MSGQGFGSAPPPYHDPRRAAAQPADLGPRFVARLIDYVVLAVVNGVLVGLLVVGMVMGSTAGSLTGWSVRDATDVGAGAVSSLLTAAITLAYFALMESTSGQTLGKMILKLETRGPGGGRPTLEQALKRNAFTAIGVLGILPFFGFVAGLLSLAAVVAIAVTINNDTAMRHGWHDNLAGGTTVVKLPS